MTVLVDSDILIEVSRARDSAILADWAMLSESDTVVLFSSITAAELWASARPNEHHVLSRLFLLLTCVPASEELGRRAGDYLRRFRKSHGVELADAFIAASAVASNAALWTRNRKHYPMSDLVFFE